MAERVAGQRLSGGDALELIVAEAASEIPVMLEPGDEPQAGEGRARAPGEEASPHEEASPDKEASPDEKAWPGEAVIDERAPARPLPALARLLEGLDTADPFELDRRLLQAVRLEQTLEAAMSPMLRCVTSSEYEWDRAYRSLADYARDVLGMSASKARALLRLGHAASFVPPLAHAYRSGALSWVKAQCLLPLFLLDVGGEQDWRPAWVSWALEVTVRRLEQDVRGALAMRTRTSTGFARCLVDPQTVAEPLSQPELRQQQMCAHEEGVEASERIDLYVEPEVACLFAGVQETFRAQIRRETRRWPSDSEVFDCLLACAVRAWSLRAPGAARPDPVIERDDYRCAVPGCSSRSHLHNHHIVFRSAGGSDAEWNRVTLCAFHHQRGVHRGELRVRGRAPDALVFDLGVRPGKPPLARFASGDLRVA
jgi:5-methylcytosine-specific restriction endonuclease McrA